MSPGLILAIDPGTTKLGWALVEPQGAVRGQGVIPFSGWEPRLIELVAVDRVAVAVVGDGTNRVNIERGLERLYPQATLVKVDETASTVDAWRLKRRVEAGSNPFLQFWFTLGQLFRPVPVDDYAARVLAERYLKRRQ